MPIIGGSYSLNVNSIYASLFNMIIAEQVFADNISGKNSKLVGEAKAEVGLYGDSKNYWSTDVLKSHPFGADSEAANLLAIDRGPSPKGQRIVIDVFRQIRLTTDQYLSKQAWMSEGSFGQFISVMKGWITETKKVYDETTYNAFVGTHISGADVNTVNVDLRSASSGQPLYGLTGDEKANMTAKLIAQALADLFDDLGDVSRKYNVYKFLRSYSEDKIKVIWNKKFINQIQRVNLPSIFHKDGLMEKFNEYSLPSRYFGTVITSTNKSSYAASTPTTGKPIDSDDDTYDPGVGNANGTIRTLYEVDVTVSAVDYHLFAGDEIPAGATIKSGGTFELGTVYIEDATVICKVVTKLPPYMSAFEVGTSFFNPRSLTETNYLTFGHNTLEAILDSAYVTVKAQL
jgi:hypothetical protein